VGQAGEEQEHETIILSASADRSSPDRRRAAPLRDRTWASLLVGIDARRGG
jgi:hypothetical protein